MSGRLADVVALTGRRAGFVIGMLGVGMLVAYLTALSAVPRANGRAVFGDATHIFVQLRSLVFDRDLHFQNDYTRIYNLQGGGPGTEWVYRDFTRNRARQKFHAHRAGTALGAAVSARDRHSTRSSRSPGWRRAPTDSN